MPRLVCLSDTHGLHDFAVPAGDILVHAGDLTKGGGLDEIHAAAGWLRALPHPEKVVIAGNHDFGFQTEPEQARAAMQGLTYLQDEEARVGGLRFWGAPWSPWFYDWAFNAERGAEIRQHWARIPSGLDVLVVHGPPRGHGDRTVGGEDVGCADLLAAVERAQPRYVVCGHIHEGYGITHVGETTIVNASTCDVRYAPVNPPHVLDVEARPGV
jgi:Icc-related predicted phosphoesterase